MALGFWNQYSTADVASFAATNSVNNPVPWTVTTTSLTNYEARLVGKTMTLAFAVDNTSVVGAARTLFIPILFGRTALRQQAAAVRINDNGAIVNGYVFTSTGSATMRVRREDEGNFTSSTSATGLYGEITFEID